MARRAFIGTTTCIGSVLLATNPLSLLAAEKPRTTKVRFGFTTYTWGKDWDIPTLIANMQQVGIFGVELRTSASYAHGVELKSTPQQRREARKQFENSPVKLVSIASGERLDWPQPDKLKAAIESVKAHLRLSQDVGSTGVRVFPNQFHPDVPREKTIAQIAEALNQLGPFAAECGQEIRLEAHGAAGDLPTIRSIMDKVTHRTVRVTLNSDSRDTHGQGFEANFNLVKDLLAHTVHLHNLKDPKFPYQQQVSLLVKSGWDGWALLEASDKVDDRIQALLEQRAIWDKLLATALQD